MEQSPNVKIISAVVVILLILGVGYILMGKSSVPESNPQTSDNDGGSQEFTAVVENIPTVGGTLSVPAEFPADIPLENGAVLESAITRYPNQGAQQLSVNYRSSRTVAQKYAEYKNYMNQAGYEITEGATNTTVRAIFGTKSEANLSVAISSSGGRTLVQLSYLLK
ncbi:MAG: hypothetical protein A3C70_03530 [Candidatus Zambryskibacteria bacterium RIFCSPHIGHO2_02_FULL_43_14]|uniref:Uncharacterized protein n=1 Tax=Candidatus Zambryskibacteria bacterium RIFCSPHIGHO2_02_FULL_43_14 TaxID=1802748 RepID=A0A1G2TFU4_9BACT|nr:MAG: hypothetical protein A2829_00975 [Candidatus Zambryskibacteria bacterium RIFCSPHIGHO2_01_FULL_43_60]OHA96157.1 MAG: hypothetical protein A3C70_03530 [Candidatus Zambryskibacteria bacterium RIFCSPHIGHO2_02_FULL_43_14]OHB03157.1 MAG: hypothetical protein A3B03_01815 [Candidatus Zambryskibacteria bacterium RIFCSPLOWO2_01_FULL_42_41]